MTGPPVAGQPVAAPVRRQRPTAAPTPAPVAAPTPVPVAGPVRRAFAELRNAASLATDLHVTRRHPVSVVQFVTRRCNARCSFCFIDFDHPLPKRTELSLEEIERLTHTFGPNLQNVNLTGGEPFLRGDLVDIARAYYRNAGVRSVYITSNGAFPDRIEAFCGSIAAEFPDRKLILSFSIDAHPEEHDRIRKVDGLFESAMRSYRIAAAAGPAVMCNVGITVSHENHAIVGELYESLIEEHGIRSITAIIVRDEGVYEVPQAHREAVVAAYRDLTARIVADQRSGRLEGYDESSLQGRLMNRKNEMLWSIVGDVYLEPRFVSPCHAASLFGVIDADGTVSPCEVLDRDRDLGNLRDHDMDFGRLWASPSTRATAEWVRESKCHCSYECAWGFNILGNARYQPKLLAAALKR